jgi:hypothetical protein
MVTLLNFLTPPHLLHLRSPPSPNWEKSARATAADMVDVKVVLKHDAARVSLLEEKVREGEQ